MFVASQRAQKAASKTVPGDVFQQPKFDKNIEKTSFVWFPQCSKFNFRPDFIENVTLSKKGKKNVTTLLTPPGAGLSSVPKLSPIRLSLLPSPCHEKQVVGVVLTTPASKEVRRERFSAHISLLG